MQVEVEVALTEKPGSVLIWAKLKDGELKAALHCTAWSLMLCVCVVGGGGGSVKEETIIIHYYQLLCCSFRADELQTHGGHGEDENHMRLKLIIFQHNWFVYKTLLFQQPLPHDLCFSLCPFEVLLGKFSVIWKIRLRVSTYGLLSSHFCVEFLMAWQIIYLSQINNRGST